MNLDRRMLRRIINEEANKLGVRLNEKTVGPSGRRGDPVVFTWLPDLKRYEATGKIIDDEKNDMVLNYPVAVGGLVGDFTCMSILYSGTLRFKWVDDNGRQIKSLDKKYDHILGLVNREFDKYTANASPDELRVIQMNFADHVKGELTSAGDATPAARAGGGRADRIVNPLYASRTAPSPAPSPMAAPVLNRRAGAAPSMSPTMSPAMSDVQAAMLVDIKSKVEVFIDISNSLMMYAGTDVPDEVFDAYQKALEDLQNTMNGG
jgi:hypothetical protein